MFDLNKLRGKVIEVYGRMKDFAKDMGLSERSISLKMNGKIDFTQSEIKKACELLNIENNDVCVYFFTAKVQKSEHIAV